MGLETNSGAFPDSDEDILDVGVAAAQAAAIEPSLCGYAELVGPDNRKKKKHGLRFGNLGNNSGFPRSNERPSLEPATKTTGDEHSPIDQSGLAGRAATG